MTRKVRSKGFIWFLVIFTVVNLLFASVTFFVSYDKKEEKYKILTACPLALGMSCKDRDYHTKFSVGLPLTFFSYENSGYGMLDTDRSNFNESVRYINVKNDKKLDLSMLFKNLAINAIVVGLLVYIAYKLKGRYAHSRN